MGAAFLPAVFVLVDAFFLLPSLGLLGSRVLRLLPQLWSLGLFFLDVVEGHAHNSFLKLCHFPSTLLRCLIHLALLVHASPSLCPPQFHGFDLLVEQRVCLGINEVVSFAIFGDKFLSMTWPDAVLGISTEVSLDDHGNNQLLFPLGGGVRGAAW